MASMIKSPGGEEMVLLSRAEYEALKTSRADADDAATLAAGIARLKSGEEALSSEDMDKLLAAKTPLAFWRKRRKVSQIELANLAGISQGYLSDLENGNKDGDVQTIARIALVLNVAIDDLIVLDDTTQTGVRRTD